MTRLSRPRCACGKISYFSEAEARSQLDELRERAKGNPRRRESRAYACNECGGWHLTSKTPPAPARPLDVVAADDPDAKPRPLFLLDDD